MADFKKSAMPEMPVVIALLQSMADIADFES
jgi:hypothetical protein